MYLVDNLKRRNILLTKKEGQYKEKKEFILFLPRIFFLWCFDFLLINIFSLFQELIAHPVVNTYFKMKLTYLKT